MPEVKNCLTCLWEPEWFEDTDQFNLCPHCNTRTVGICKKIALIVPILGQPADWPEALLNAYAWVEKQGDRISRSKPHPFTIKRCPAHQPKTEAQE